MPALGFILTQTLLLSAEWRGWRRLHRAAKSRKHFCIHLVGLGQDASRPRILTNTHGLHQSDFYFALFQALEQRLLIAATGFADQLHWCSTLFNPADEKGVAAPLVRQTTECSRPSHIQMRFGHVDPDIDNTLLHGL